MKIKAFLKLLDRYQKRKTSDNENKMLDAWYDAIDHTDLQRNVRSDEEAGRLMWDAISKGIHEGKTEDQIPQPVFWKRNFYFRLAAACLLCMMVAFIGYHYSFLDTPVIAGVKNEVLDNMRSFTNENEPKKTFKLPDGSLVTLDKGASLFFPSTFTDHDRHVYLKGDVYFNIAHDKSRPFYVHANNIVTKVLGTSFTIRENKKTNSIEVAVITGVVEVTQQKNPEYATQNSPKVLLTQNKKVTYYQSEETLITGLVEQPQIIETKLAELSPSKFNYLEKPLAEIIPVLQDAYGVRIVMDNEKLQNCVITADLSQENTLFKQLEILCESINAKYQLINDSVTISGNGCDITK
jgi:transmembrane sensor